MAAASPAQCRDPPVPSGTEPGSYRQSRQRLVEEAFHTASDENRFSESVSRRAAARRCVSSSIRAWIGCALQSCRTQPQRLVVALPVRAFEPDTLINLIVVELRPAELPCSPRPRRSRDEILLSSCIPHSPTQHGLERRIFDHIAVAGAYLLCGLSSSRPSMSHPANAGGAEHRARYENRCKSLQREVERLKCTPRHGPDGSCQAGRSLCLGSCFALLRRSRGMDDDHGALRRIEGNSRAVGMWLFICFSFVEAAPCGLVASERAR